MKFSFTILSGSLQSNRTYQFMVYLGNIQNSSLNSTGYTLVLIDDSDRQMILMWYIGVSKSSGNDILLPHIEVDKNCFLHRMIERKKFFLSMLFDHTSGDIILKKS